MKPFLIIKTGGTFEEFTPKRGDFEHWTARAMGLTDSQWECCHVQGGDPLPDPTLYAGCVITGSHDMVTEDLDWIKATINWVQKAEKSGLPILGICFGHQLLAMAFDGEAGFHPDGPEIGTKDVILEDEANDDPLFTHLPRLFSAHTTHHQCALSVPPEGVLLAASEHEPHQAFRVGDHVWGIQFHPEFDAEATRYYIVKQSGVIEERKGCVNDLLCEVRETPESTELLTRFVEYCWTR